MDKLDFNQTQVVGSDNLLPILLVIIVLLVILLWALKVLASRGYIKTTQSDQPLKIISKLSISHASTVYVLKHNDQQITFVESSKQISKIDTNINQESSSEVVN